MRQSWRPGRRRRFAARTGRARRQVIGQPSEEKPTPACAPRHRDQHTTTWMKLEHAREVSGGGRLHLLCSASSKLLALQTRGVLSSSSCTAPSSATRVPSTACALRTAASQPAHSNLRPLGRSPCLLCLPCCLANAGQAMQAWRCDRVSICGAARRARAARRVGSVRAGGTRRRALSFACVCGTCALSSRPAAIPSQNRSVFFKKNYNLQIGLIWSLLGHF